MNLKLRQLSSVFESVSSVYVPEPFEANTTND